MPVGYAFSSPLKIRIKLLDVCVLMRRIFSLQLELEPSCLTSANMIDISYCKIELQIIINELNNEQRVFICTTAIMHANGFRHAIVENSPLLKI